MTRRGWLAVGASVTLALIATVVLVIVLMGGGDSGPSDLCRQARLMYDLGRMPLSVVERSCGAS